MIILVNTVALILFVFIIWWFWISKPRAESTKKNVVDIVVDNGVYTPARIEVKQGQPLTMRFLRKDASPCAEKVIFEDWNLSAELPIEEIFELKVPTDDRGEHAFTCQMQMYRGTLVII